MAALNPAPSARPAKLPHFGARARLGRAKLRVGVFAKSALQPRWVVESLARIACSEFAEIAVLAIGENKARVWTPWSVYERIDHAAFGDGPHWSRPSDLRRVVSDECHLRLALSDDLWRQRLRDLRLDVALVLDDIDDERLAGIARHGVWRHCFGEGDGVAATHAGLREVIAGAPVIASSLRVHRSGERPDRVVYRSWSRAFAFTMSRSRDHLFGKTSEFLARALCQLHRHGECWLEQQEIAGPVAKGEGAPSLLAGLGTMGLRIARRSVEAATTIGQWSLAFRFTPDESWEGSLDGFFRLVPPPDRFWADPFPVSVDGRHFIFFEELPFKTGKGHISVVEVDRDGRASEPVVVLERDYHLSYPFLVHDAGTLYMVPETGFNRTVEIYRCDEFPYRWHRQKVLLDNVFGADATFFRAPASWGTPERWWMFANVGNDDVDINDELHVFSADKLLGEWKPHRSNPVKSDVRSARPAGRLFWQGNRLYRPAQIGTPIYGAGIALHRVTRLTRDEYGEEEDRKIVPCTGGLHTINRSGDLSVTDVFARRSRIRTPWLRR